MFRKKTEDFNVVAAIDELLDTAIDKRASDIHIEPFANFIRVRLRIDGVLLKYSVFPIHKKDEIIAVIKVMAELDSTKKRMAQDGRLTFSRRNRTVEVRVSALPYKYGEKMVLRLQNSDKVELNLDLLGIAPDRLPAVKHTLAGHQGLLLVTGSTGSGKTTTIYAMLTHVATDELNIVTLEDPIEYEIEGFIQVQMGKELQMDYADALRAVLRQDPDVLVIGEIRDAETARIAIRAALTGHLVFASLHTNGAVDTILRLREMGLEPYLIAAALKLISYQRLVRRLCPECREETMPESGQAALFALRDDEVVYRARGCDQCSHTGYLGRRPLFQLLLVDDPVAELLARGETAGQLRTRLEGMLATNLHNEACRMIKAGITSCEEVVKNGL